MVPIGKSGEICVRSDLMMRGYYRRQDLTAAAIVDGWLRTGDIGYLDDKGYLHVTDRKKDMIISGGSNVYPARWSRCSRPTPPSRSALWSEFRTTTGGNASSPSWSLGKVSTSTRAR